MGKHIEFELNDPTEVFMIGISWIDGEQEDITTGDITPCKCLSIGLLLFQINIYF